MDLRENKWRFTVEHPFRPFLRHCGSVSNLITGLDCGMLAVEFSAVTVETFNTRKIIDETVKTLKNQGFVNLLGSVENVVSKLTPIILGQAKRDLR